MFCVGYGIYTREPCKKVKKNKLKNLTLMEKPSFRLILRLPGGGPQTSLRKSKCVYFYANILKWIGIVGRYGE